MRNAPLDIICLSSIDWDFLWQGHHEIMTSLALRGSRILFVENTGVRAPQLSDAPRLSQRLGNWTRSAGGFRQERENLFVHSPLLLPFPYSRLAGRINRALLGGTLRRWLARNGFGRPLVWTFLPTPLARETIRDLDPCLTVYYCIDDLASSSPAAGALRESEEELFKEADVVFVTSEKLRERAARFSDRVHVFPFGVDFEAFDRARRSGVEVPSELRGLPRPLVGYVGGVHRWVDQELLAQVADHLPSMGFVFVGPRQTDLSILASRPNVHLLGARPHGSLPAYIKAFDVGIIPYVRCDYTDHVYPTKVNEYLAMGIPVVATDLPEIHRVNARHPGLVTVAGDGPSFAAALLRSSEGSPAADVDRRVRVARTNSWAARISEMCNVIDGLLRVSGSPREIWAGGAESTLAQAAGAPW